MWGIRNAPVNLFTYVKKILNGNIHFMCNKSMVIFIKSCLVTLNKFFYFDFPWLRNTETTYMSFVNAIIEEEWQYH